jgi:ABC-type polysaccharide/polyol phosphate export permease
MNSLRPTPRCSTKLPVPKAVFPLATVLAGVVNLVLALVPLFADPAGHRPPVAPVAALPAGRDPAPPLFTLGAGLLLSPLAAFFSDIIELVMVFLTLRCT